VSIRERFRNTLLSRLRRHSVISLARLACWVALVGLATMAASILNPAPLIVIFAMSVGQVIGIVAFLCFLLSILVDVMRGTDHSPDAPGPAQRLRESSSPRDVADST